MAGNVDTAKDAYQKFSSGDIEGATSNWSDDVEWDGGGQDLPGGGKHQGKEEAIQVLQKAVGSWDEFALSMDEFVDGGDTVVALGHSNVKKGGQEAELPVVHILRFEGDQLKRLQILTDTHEANKILTG